MAYAIATIVIMLCVIVALSINLVRERKAHMTEIDKLEADVMNANMHVSVLSEDKVTMARTRQTLEELLEELQGENEKLYGTRRYLCEQTSILQNRCSLLGCELKIEFFQYFMLRTEHELDRNGLRALNALEDAKELLFKEGHHDEESWREQQRSMIKAVKQELGINV